jgi:hypothetical protein
MSLGKDRTAPCGALRAGVTGLGLLLGAILAAACNGDDVRDQHYGTDAGLNDHYPDAEPPRTAPPPAPPAPVVDAAAPADAAPEAGAPPDAAVGAGDTAGDAAGDAGGPG